MSARTRIVLSSTRPHAPEKSAVHPVTGIITFGHNKQLKCVGLTPGSPQKKPWCIRGDRLNISVEKALQELFPENSQKIQR